MAKMADTILLKDIVNPEDKNEPIFKWEFMQIADLNRVYFKPRDKEKSGFVFSVVSWAGQSADTEMWHPIDTSVEILFEGMAFFDGIRHTYSGHELTNNKGYLFGLNPWVGARIFEALGQLEKRFCLLPNEKI